MKTRLTRVVIGSFVLLSFAVSSCMMNDTEDFPDFNEQLQKDLKIIDDYLAANNLSAEKDVDGFIRYVVHHRSGDTKKATLDSCATVNYAGFLLSDGSEFDKSTAPFSFPVNSVIDGWRVGIPLMNVGDSVTFYIPSGLAYGFYGYAPKIPGNANLVFRVGLEKVGSTYKNSDRSCN